MCARLRVNKTLCTGCNACAEICPRACIKMQPDRSGFLFPVLDIKVCVDCGLCVNICPIEDNIMSSPLQAYAARNISEIEQKGSSSGGVADLLSRFVVQSGGVVYGCVYEGIDVKHIRIDNIENLWRLKGSKYVQSDIRGLFAKVKQDLRKELEVLFIGTPCQVAGLKKYLGRDYSKLYLVDLICHGTPSQKMLKEHITNIAQGKKINKISFRNGSKYVLTIMGEDYVYVNDLWSNRYEDTYYNAFVDNIINRESCYNCKYAVKERVSDITIGDFWGLNDMSLFSVRPESGVSVMLPCSEKGIEMISKIESNLEIYERSIQEAIDGNKRLQGLPFKPKRAYLFKLLYTFLPFELSVRISLIDRIFLSRCRKIKRQFLNDSQQ